MESRAWRDEDDVPLEEWRDWVASQHQDGDGTCWCAECVREDA